MQFSKGHILKSGSRIVINCKVKSGSPRKILFNQNDYLEFATIKRKHKTNINKWVLFIILLVLMIGWVWLSEYFGSIKYEMSADSYKQWKRIDNIGMPVLILLTFATLFADVLGDVKFVRYILALPFNRRQFYVIIILKTGVEYEFPVRNKKEAKRIIQFIQSK